MSAYKREKKWWIRFRFDHQRYYRASPDNSEAGAKNYEALLRQRLLRGESIEKTEKQRDLMPSFKEFSSQWLEVDVKNNNKYSEVLNKQSILRAHLNPFFGKMSLDNITSLNVENFKSQKIKKGLANKTINNHLIVLSKCLKTAQEREIIEKIPKIRLLKVQPQKFDFLTEEESQQLLDGCSGLVYDMVLVALKTGLRFGELIALEWEDIDFQNNLMIVRKSFSCGRLGSTKSNKIRYIPLLDEISQVLFTRKEKKGFIFMKNGESLCKMSCLRWLHRACVKAEMRKIGWHTLRHTFASHLAQNGVSITIVKELLGHSDIRTTMRYSHLTPLATRTAVNTLEKKIGDNAETISILNERKMIDCSPLEVGIIANIQ